MKTFLRSMRRITRLQKLLNVWKILCIARFSVQCAQTVLLRKKQKG